MALAGVTIKRADQEQIIIMIIDYHLMTLLLDLSPSESEILHKSPALYVHLPVLSPFLFYPC